MPDRVRCLQILGLGPSATRDEMKAAYHDLVKVWHPDRFGHDPALAQKAQERLKEINEAYGLLMRMPERSGASGPRPAPGAQAWPPAGRSRARHHVLWNDPWVSFLVLLLLLGLLLLGLAWSTGQGTSPPNIPSGKSLQDIA